MSNYCFFRTAPDPHKLRTLTHQLKDIEKNYPHEKVDFYFFDDDGRGVIFPTLITHFSKSKSIPLNVSVFFIKNDTYDACSTPIEEIGRFIPSSPEGGETQHEITLFKHPRLDTPPMLASQETPETPGF